MAAQACGGADGATGEVACAWAQRGHTECVEPLGEARGERGDAPEAEKKEAVWGGLFGCGEGEWSWGKVEGGLGTRYGAVGWTLTSPERWIG